MVLGAGLYPDMNIILMVPMVELQYFGNSFFKIKNKKDSILIDPISGGKLKKSDVDDASLILLTNETEEHFDKTLIERVVSKGKVKVVAHDSILKQLDLSRSQKVSIGIDSEVFLNNFKIKTTTAHYPQSFYPLGFLIDCGGKKIYHAGITSLLDTFSKIDADVALLPMNSKSMDVVDVVRAAKMMKPKKLVPMHCELKDLRNSPTDLKKRIEESVLNTETILLTPGKKMKV
jgi:L-ascorbate metabolism protein UlaG (beta-lactamase superfamily)